MRYAGIFRIFFLCYNDFKIKDLKSKIVQRLFFGGAIRHQDTKTQSPPWRDSVESKK